MLNIFVTATDSNIGKTFISAGLAATMQSLGYSTCVYKPIQTKAPGKNGFAQSPDLLYVKNVDPYIKTRSTYLLKENASPLIAAEMENVFIDHTLIKKEIEACSKEFDCLITEGTGGLMTPVSINLSVSDLIKKLELPTLIIVNPQTSSINQILLTIQHAQLKGLLLSGVVINNLPEETSDIDTKSCPRLIEEYTDAKVLGIVKQFSDPKNINPNDLITSILNGIDIESVFNVKIAKLNLDLD